MLVFCLISCAQISYLASLFVTKDSINRDGAEKIKESLTERGLVAEGSTVKSEEKIAPPPSISPTREEDSLKSVPSPTVVTEPSFFSGTEGIATIVTCGVVVFLIAGFLFYKGMRPSKDDDAFSWESDEFSYKDERRLSQGTYQQTEHDHSYDSTAEVLPTYYVGTETNIFGREVGSRRMSLINAPDYRQHQQETEKPEQQQGWLDEKVQIHDSIISSNQSNENLVHDVEDLQQERVRQRLDAFETRVREKNNNPDNAKRREMGESRRKLDDFNA